MDKICELKRLEAEISKLTDDISYVKLGTDHWKEILIKLSIACNKQIDLIFQGTGIERTKGLEFAASIKGQKSGGVQ